MRSIAAIVAISASALALYACASLAGVSNYSDAPCAGGTCADAETPDQSTAADSGTDADACTADLSQDGKNCGQCGHDCLGGICVAGACRPAIIATGQTYPTVLLRSDSFLLWPNYFGNAIRKLPIDVGQACFGDGCPNLASGANVVSPNGLSSSGGFVYWADSIQSANGVVMRAPLDGGSSEIIAGQQPWPQATATHGAYVYWTNRFGMNWVARTPLAGGAVDVVASGNYEGATGVTIDESFVYWSNYDKGLFYRTPVDTTCAGDACVWMSVGASAAGQLVADGSYIYAAISSGYDGTRNGSILRIPKSCGDRSCAVPIAMGLFDPQGIALDDTSLYWVDITEMTVRKVALGSTCNGSACTLVARNVGRVGGLAVDSKAIYFASEKGPTDQDDAGTVWRLAK